EGGSEPHWKHKAVKGNVSVPKHFVPRGSGTLGAAWLKRETIVFAGESTAREQYSHIDVRRTVISLGYLPVAIDEVFLGLIEIVSFDRKIESAELQRLQSCADFSALALSTALAYENERNGQFESINRITQLYDLERS